MTAGSRRDNRIDLIRGYAMLTITVNHLGWLCTGLGYQGPLVPTLTHYGYSSAAEIFYLVSGYMVGLVYFAQPDTARILALRAWRIYKVNLGLFVAAVAIGAVFGQPLSGLTGTAFTVERPAEGLGLFLVLAQAPVFLDVLQLYVILLVTAGALVRPLKSRTGLVLLLSATVWLLANLIDGFNLPGGPPTDDYRYNFNPFAYQALFIAAIVAGRARLHRRIVALVGDPRIEAAVYAALGLSVVVFVFALLPGKDILAGRTNLGPVRIAHGLLVVLFLFCVLKRTERLGDTLPFRLVAGVGRQSLACFVGGSIAVYVLAGLSMHTEGTLAFLALNTVAVAAVLMIGAAGERRKAARASSAASG